VLSCGAFVLLALAVTLAAWFLIERLETGQRFVQAADRYTTHGCSPAPARDRPCAGPSSAVLV